MNTRTLMSGAVTLSLLLSAVGLAQHRRMSRRPPAKGAVCGDPTVACKTSAQFEPHDLPFRVPPQAVIWESETFYAVILKSAHAPNDACDKFVPEAERQEAQGLFPHNKVFASRCADPGALYYTNVKPDTRFIAVYAGRTRAEADALLAQVKATGKYPDANLRRMSMGFNGTWSVEPLALEHAVAIGAADGSAGRLRVD